MSLRYPFIECTISLSQRLVSVHHKTCDLKGSDTYQPLAAKATCSPCLAPDIFCQVCSRSVGGSQSEMAIWYCGISVLLAKDLGQQVPGSGLVCYVTTDKLRGGVSCSSSGASSLLLTLYPFGAASNLSCVVSV